jgi:transposase, IS30 family
MKPKPKYHRLSAREREEISRLLIKALSFREIAHCLNRHVSTISREVGQPYFGRKYYRAHVGQERALRRRHEQRGRKRKLDKYPRLKNYVLTRLWLYWSPEQIAAKLKTDYPKNFTMRISPETIYAYVYVQPKGELKRCLVKALRRHHKYRYRKNRIVHRQIRNIPDLVSIEERPGEAKSRKVPGHWEGDLLIGKRKQSALGSLVERTSRAVILAPLKAFDHHTVAKIFAKEMQTLPLQMKKTLTYDRGGEMSSHQLFTKKTKIKVYFAHSKSPWERGTNENTNGLVRQFFPKGTDFKKVTRKEIKRAQRLLNQRPRKTLKFQTPEEVFNKLVLR